MKIKKAEILTDLIDGKQIGYIPTLIELSKTEDITGSLAYVCGRNLTSFSNALKDYEKTRTILLESKALKDEEGKAKLEPVEKEENIENSPKKGISQSQMKYVYENEEIEKDILKELNKLEELELEVEIYPIPASEIIALKSMKNGGVLVFKLGEIIDHSK